MCSAMDVVFKSGVVINDQVTKHYIYENKTYARLMKPSAAIVERAHLGFAVDAQQTTATGCETSYSQHRPVRWPDRGPKRSLIRIRRPKMQFAGVYRMWNVDDEATD